MSYGENPLPPNHEISPPADKTPAWVEQPPQQPESPRENPVWGIWDVVGIAVVVILAIVFFSMVVMGVALHGTGTVRATPPELARDPRIVIPAQFAAYLVVILYMVSLVRRRRQRFWEAIRWKFPGRTWFAWVALGVALALMIQSASTLLPIPKSLPIERYFRDTAGAWMMAAFGLTLAPLVEELFFRGFMYPAVARKLGEATGIVITGALFALIHTSQLANAWAPLLLLLAVGVVLTTVRARTGSVGATFMIHVGYNGTLFTMLYIASDHFRHLEKVT